MEERYKLAKNITELLETRAGGSEGIDKKKLQHFKNKLAEKRTELKQFDDEILEHLYDNTDDRMIDKEIEEASECA